MCIRDRCNWFHTRLFIFCQKCIHLIRIHFRKNQHFCRKFRTVIFFCLSDVYKRQMPYGSHCALTASPMYDTLLPFACACDPDLMVDDRQMCIRDRDYGLYGLPCQKMMEGLIENRQYVTYFFPLEHTETPVDQGTCLLYTSRCV